MCKEQYRNFRRGTLTLGSSKISEILDQKQRFKVILGDPEEKMSAKLA